MYGCGCIVALEDIGENETVWMDMVQDKCVKCSVPWGTATSAVDDLNNYLKTA